MDSDNYDPLAPEGDTGARSAYISRKDFKVIGIILVLLTAGLYPIYRYQVRQAQKSICTSNMKAIYDAVNMYAESKDDRFPPIYRTGEGILPGLGDSGKPYTWCDDIQPLMSKRYSFICPSADKDDLSTCESPSSSTGILQSSYGMYFPYSAYNRSLIADPDQTAVFAETSNQGGNDSYDPLKMTDSHGTVLPDGFVIGWDDSNAAPDGQTRFVTRLAYPGSSQGKFSKSGESRHDGGIHVLMASGELRLLGPESARFEHSAGSFTGLWAPPAVSGG